jgi:hypothetical protein
MQYEPLITQPRVETDQAADAFEQQLGSNLAPMMI